MNMEFFKGLFSIAMIYTVGWLVYQAGYSNGADAERCQERHGYDFSRVKSALADMEIKK